MGGPEAFVVAAAALSMAAFTSCARALLAQSIAPDTCAMREDGRIRIVPPLLPALSGLSQGATQKYGDLGEYRSHTDQTSSSVLG